jgi:all-trans-retinol 13,14-reductase
MQSSAKAWDAIVIGSGMGGLSCAAALVKTGHRTLVLEQHSVPGGLTQTFSRSGFTWDVGIHYLGMGAGGQPRAILDWLSDGQIEMASMGPVYDTFHFPGGFEIQLPRPESALRLELKEKFPGSEAEIDAFFSDVAEAERAGRTIFALRAMPTLLGKFYGLWHQTDILKWWDRTTADVLEELISDPKLRSVLAGRWGDYGSAPGESSFGMHAMLTRHYLHGGYYPVGGGKVFADKLIPVIEGGGGEVRVNTQVRELLVDNGSVTGVRLADGTPLHAPRVFSDAGARNTVSCLLPPELRDSEWAREVLSFVPSPCHVALYLGLEGDIRSSGATASNHWIFETWDVDARLLWQDPVAQPTPPGVFVSFPTLKDPHHDPGEKCRHTAEVVALTSWDAFSKWEGSTLGHRPEEYVAFKEVITQGLLATFRSHFPALAPMIVCHELSTPLSTASFIGAPRGAIYGLETSPRRFLSDSLRVKTPIPGLFLTGQDVASPGVTGAMMGGLLAAAAIEPKVFRHVA